MTMMTRKETWTVAEAKAHLSELLERAASQPQVITRRGRRAAVVVSVEEWERKTRRVGSLADFFAGSPLREGPLEVERWPDPLREPEL